LSAGLFRPLCRCGDGVGTEYARQQHETDPRRQRLSRCCFQRQSR
jgi:hypothetical protein